jgi:hypothetical protein
MLHIPNQQLLDESIIPEKEIKKVRGSLRALIIVSFTIVNFYHQLQQLIAELNCSNQLQPSI